MNIFKILSNGDGSINEPNVSSLLGYLLDPSETHGLSSGLLERFINPLILEFPEVYKSISTKNRKTVNLSINSPYTVDLLTEEKLSFLSRGDNYKCRHIDIIIEIFKSDELIHCIAIENKINALSVGKNQLEEEFRGLVQKYSELQTKPIISFIYLIPHAIKNTESEFNKLEKEIANHKDVINTIAKTYYWGKKDDGAINVNKMLEDLLKEEAYGDIEPLNEIVKYIIKSFKNFINSDFKSYKEEKSDSKEKQDYGKPVFEFLQDIANSHTSDEVIEKSILKTEFTNTVKSKSDKELDKGTRDAKITVSIVNERNRIHYGINNPNDMSKNIFYYPNTSDTKKIKKIDFNNVPEDLKIYWKSGDEVKEALLKEFIRID